MIRVNDHKNETGEVAQVVLSLLGIASEQEFHHVVQWLGKSLDVDPSEEFPAVVINALSEIEASDRRNDIK